ncbi:uncharacterized protein N7483_013155 [Penicillium malachiteum]|uniref:uncharacterized protein n=1 Tax=Penicillium malachiteum TaxID=1324776 RepID=UPI0025486D7A|nr:uncharacterized protein N7483_013155 [Penicillium malachiteum]KAJ5715974.1 hypothetical protein N7483_013155 [Penicillium malachiteum]
MKDVDMLVRRVEFPAHANGPLHRLMFPHETEHQLDYTEDEIKWTINGIYEAIGLEDECVGQMGYPSDS